MSANPVTDLDVVLACQEADIRTLHRGYRVAAGQLLINFITNKKMDSTKFFVAGDVEVLAENAMISAFGRDLIEVKTNLRWATLTAKGRQLAKEST